MSTEIWCIRGAAVLLVGLVVSALLGWARSQRRLLAAYRDAAEVSRRGLALTRLLGGVVDCRLACPHCVKQIHDGLGAALEEEEKT